jgi:hypothetical protein
MATEVVVIAGEGKVLPRRGGELSIMELQDRHRYHSEMVRNHTAQLEALIAKHTRLRDQYAKALELAGE